MQYAAYFAKLRSLYVCKIVVHRFAMPTFNNDMANNVGYAHI